MEYNGYISSIIFHYCISYPMYPLKKKHLRHTPHLDQAYVERQRRRLEHTWSQNAQW